MAVAMTPQARPVRYARRYRATYPSSRRHGETMDLVYKRDLMRALYVILPVLCVLAIAYRYYSAFIAARIMALDDSRPTPAHVRNDGHNYHPTHRLVLFG